MFKRKCSLRYFQGCSVESRLRFGWFEVVSLVSLWTRAVDGIATDTDWLKFVNTCSFFSVFHNKCRLCMHSFYFKCFIINVCSIACIYVFYFIFRFASCNHLGYLLYFHLFYFFSLLIANKRLYITYNKIFNQSVSFCSLLLLLYRDEFADNKSYSLTEHLRHDVAMITPTLHEVWLWRHWLNTVETMSSWLH